MYEFLIHAGLIFDGLALRTIKLCLFGYLVNGLSD